MREVFCTGCGAQRQGTASTCAACGAPCLGARWSEAWSIRFGERGVRVPEVCCCCLNPRQWVKRHKILTHVETTGAGRVEEFVRVPFPWCRRCLLLRYGFFWASIVGFAVLTVVFGCFVAELMDGSTTSALPFLGAMAAAGVLTLLLRALVTAVLPVKPGHVPMCLAFDDHGGGMGSVVFHNRAFAQLWRQLNGT